MFDLFKCLCLGFVEVISKNVLSAFDVFKSICCFLSLLRKDLHTNKNDKHNFPSAEPGFALGFGRAWVCIGFQCFLL